MSRPAGMPGLRGRRRDESGYVAAVVVIMASSFLFALAALGVDVARWWLEAQRVQAAADASALGSVSFVPMDPANADKSVKEIAARNGYDSASDSVDIKTAPGAKASQLRVTVCSTISNGFGAILGVSTTKVCRTALADYTGPAPMGSPCNTFANEPTGGGGASSPNPSTTAQGGSPAKNCPVNPQFWATVEGPQTWKGAGDRYSTKNCQSGVSVDGCSSADVNTEYREQGYYWIIRVGATAVGKQIDLQVFDPEYAVTGTKCESLQDNFTPVSPSNANSPNGYVTDAQSRYTKASAASSTTVASKCPGDYNPGTNTVKQMTTSFAVRQQTDKLDPSVAEVQPEDGSLAPCIKQFTGQTTTPGAADLSSASGTYDQQLASTFHNWVSICKFTPKRVGDYYLQVRTNVSFDGNKLSNSGGNQSMISTGNTAVIADKGNTTAGTGDNSFAIRAVTPTGYEKSVAVSGYEQMPIFVNNTGATASFNLIRVLPGGASKSIQFSYFDIGDVSGSSGTANIQVTVPGDATGSITTKPFGDTGCRGVGGYAGADGEPYPTCKAPFTIGTSGSNNGKVETLSVPIPNDYSCSFNDPAGCWYGVTVTFPSGVTPTDITTWSANITGDPVRLLE